MTDFVWQKEMAYSTLNMFKTELNLFHDKQNVLVVFSSCFHFVNCRVFLLLWNDFIKYGFISAKLSKTSVANVCKCFSFDELTHHCYIKAVPYEIHYCYEHFLRLYVEFFHFLCSLDYANHPDYWCTIKVAVYKCIVE